MCSSFTQVSVLKGLYSFFTWRHYSKNATVHFWIWPHSCPTSQVLLLSIIPDFIQVALKYFPLRGIGYLGGGRGGKGNYFCINIFPLNSKSYRNQMLNWNCIFIENTRIYSEEGQIAISMWYHQIQWNTTRFMHSHTSPRFKWDCQIFFQFIHGRKNSLANM